MAFDAIETTVANALLLKAQMGETEPIVLKTKPFSDLTAYCQKTLNELSLSVLLQEPLGKYCFSRFLADANSDVILQICTDIRLIRGSSGKGKRIRGMKIVNGLCDDTADHVVAPASGVSPSRPSTALSNLKGDDKGVSVSDPPKSPRSMAAPALMTAADLTSSVQAQGGKNTMGSVSGADQRVKKADRSPNEKSAESGLNGKDISLHNQNQTSNGDSDEESSVPKASERADPRKEVEESLGTKSMKPGVNQDKVIDRAIRYDGPLVNEGALSNNMANSSDSLISTGASTIVWTKDLTRKIGQPVLDLLYGAVVNPDLFESDQMMEAFEQIYSALYSDLSQTWFPRFIRSGEPFQRYICHREYAETTKVGFDSFQMFRALGKGAFGMVSAVQKKDTKKIYAMKSMSKKKIKHYHSEKLCEIEKAALQKVDSPFILNLKYSFSNDKNVFLVLALCYGGDLQFHLTEVRGHRFSESRAQFYAAEVILALEHLHKRKFVYRDLKPGNILLDSDGHIVLSDLGLVHRVSSKRPLRTLAGTSGYWAPEVMKRQIYDYTADWWSFGIFLHKLLSGRRPKCDCKKPKQWCPFGTKKEHAEMAKANEPMTFEIVLDDLSFSANAQDLLRKLLEPDPAKRLGANGAEEVKRHAFFADIQWLELLEKQVEPPFKPTRNDVNAVSLGEISSEGDRKFKKVPIDDKDDKFYERWDYVSVKTVQEEIVSAFEHNLELLKKPPKKVVDRNKSQKCCTIL